jgi:hypothetical protein
MHVVERWSNWPCVKFLFLKRFVTIFDPDIPSSSEHGYLLLYPWFFFILDAETFHYLDSSTSVTILSTKCFLLIEFGGWCSLLVLQGRDWISLHTHAAISVLLSPPWMNTTTVPTNCVQHFLAKYLFIYLKWGPTFWNFNFPEFQQLRNSYAKNTSCVVPLAIGTERFSIFKHFWKKLYIYIYIYIYIFWLDLLPIFLYQNISCR